MELNPIADDKHILMKLQNSNKPDQVVYFVIDRAGGGKFTTQGLKELFGVKEIAVESRNVLESLPEFAEVLSFLFESMSAAQDFRLPFAYQSEFDFAGKKYTLNEEGSHRILRRVGE